MAPGRTMGCQATAPLHGPSLLRQRCDQKDWNRRLPDRSGLPRCIKSHKKSPKITNVYVQMTVQLLGVASK